MSDAPRIDPYSATWRAVAAWVTENLNTRMDALTRPGIPEREADHLRGEIATLRAMRDLPLRSRDPAT